MMYCKVLCLLAIFSFAAIAEDIDESPQPSTITFNRTDNNGLMWPLPDWDDSGNLLMHSTHCVKKVRDYDQNDLTEINFMHGNHCAEIVRLVVSFFDTVQDYGAHEVICVDLRHLSRMKRAVRRYRFRRNAYKSQNEKEFFEESNNLGLILLKQWRNQTLTVAEITYLNKMKEPQTIRVGALGVYCNFGEDVSSVKDALTNYLADFQNKVSIQKLTINEDEN